MAILPTTIVLLLAPIAWATALILHDEKISAHRLNDSID